MVAFSGSEVLFTNPAAGLRMTLDAILPLPKGEGRGEGKGGKAVSAFPVAYNCNHWSS
jgi:hypothetical protein